MTAKIFLKIIFGVLCVLVVALISVDILASNIAERTYHATLRRELEEAKLSIFQAVDAPESVNDEAMTPFLTGVTPEMEQERRERLLDTSASQVKEVAAKYLTRIGADEDTGERSSNEVVLGAEQPWLHPDHGWVRMPLGTSSASAKEGAEEEEDPYVTI